MALEELDCSDNVLEQLPDNLGDLIKLRRLNCSNNFLQQLPYALRDIFGEDWCQDTLLSQTRLTPQRAILPLYAAVTEQIEDANHVETPEEAVTNNLAKLKLNSFF